MYSEFRIRKLVTILLNTIMFMFIVISVVSVFNFILLKENKNLKEEIKNCNISHEEEIINDYYTPAPLEVIK